MEKLLPATPAKRYFTIGEASELCGVKPHVLRYWEQEFIQLRPMKRRGNRRFYQHHEVLVIRLIRDLLHEQGFTIVGARNKLQEAVQSGRDRRRNGDAIPDVMPDVIPVAEGGDSVFDMLLDTPNLSDFHDCEKLATYGGIRLKAEAEHLKAVLRELNQIRDLLNTKS